MPATTADTGARQHALAALAQVQSPHPLFPPGLVYWLMDQSIPLSTSAYADDNHTHCALGVDLQGRHNGRSRYMLVTRRFLN